MLILSILFEGNICLWKIVFSLNDHKIFVIATGLPFSTVQLQPLHRMQVMRKKGHGFLDGGLLLFVMFVLL